jgi:topoisomerase-4 subunit B
LYALDESEMSAIMERLRSEGVKESAWRISRFKGLGEMNPDQLKDTTMHPDTRRLTPVRISPESASDTRAMFTMLMSKNEASSRRAWMEAKGNDVDADV